MLDLKRIKLNTIGLGDILAEDDNRLNRISRKDIAVIGIGGKFGSSDSIEAFWNQLCAGKDMIRSFPKRRDSLYKKYKDLCRKKGILLEQDESYNKAGYLEEIEEFDYELFSMSPSEAKLMDPHQRLFLQCALSALENGGYGGNRAKGSNTGIFVGFSDDFNFSYNNLISIVDPAAIPMALTGNIKSIIASRLAYLFDMKGPSMLVNTACSSSLVAVHLACKSLIAGECEMAIAGGVKLYLEPQTKAESGVGILSHDGKARTFDNSSEGTGLGEGAGAVLLKPLSKAVEDGDLIYAVIKGSCINQDGTSVGITAPNPSAQTNVIEGAWKDAGVDPESITYIEAHGTGTKLGDPIEIMAINEAFRKHTDKKQFCAVGSVKSNLGHLDSAAGIAGLIKSILSLHERKITPHLHFRLPNEKINFEQSAVYVNDRLTNWEKGHFPRRCGISSFGLSGTNCHIVLEEAPEIKEKRHSTSKRQRVLCLSAKSVIALDRLVGQYYELLSKRKGIELDDLCFTSNACRGHYENRLAILFENIEDLLDILNEIQSKSVANVEVKNAYYGRHKSVPDIKQNKLKGEVTQAEIGEISCEANRIIKEYLEQRKGELLKEICILYICGAKVTWEELYRTADTKTIILPGYPLEKKCCWPDMDITEGRKSNYKLVHSNIVKSHNIDIYMTKFSVEDHWILSEHKVSGSYVVPGTTYIEMILQIFGLSRNGCIPEFQDILFYTPMSVVKGKDKEAHTIIKYGLEEYAEFSVSSRNSEDDDTWVKHVDGRIKFIDGEKVSNQNISEIMDRCSMENFKSIYKESDARIVEVGPRWDNITQVYVGNGEVLALMELKEQFSEDMNQYYVHPALMDCAVNLANTYVGSGPFLPFFYENLRIYDRIPQKFYSIIKRNDLENTTGETAKFDIVLTKLSGEVFSFVKNYTVKRVREVDLVPKKKESKIFHAIKWIQDKNIREESFVKSVLLFKSNANFCNKLIKQLKQQKVEVITVQAGENYQKIDDYTFSINLKQSNYNILFDQLRSYQFSHIVFMLDLFDNTLDITDNIIGKRERSIDSLFFITKAIINHKITRDIELALVSDHTAAVTGNEEYINPYGAALFGLGKSIQEENSSIKCRCLDIDKSTDEKTIANEIMSKRTSYKVAFREGYKYIEQLYEMNIEDLEDSGIQIKQNGCYVITGGTGGLGIQIAAYLASKDAKNLCLISRSGLPKRTDWNTIIKENSTKVANTIREIMRLEEMGINVSVYGTDISNEKEVNITLCKIKSLFGSINGVVHCAGVAGDGILAAKNFNTFNRVISPKIDGTCILHKLTRQDELDFFVLYSSVSSIMGGIGQGDYSAANSFLDAFAGYRNQSVPGTVAINWAPWADTGMAYDYGLKDTGLFKMLDNQTGVDAFNKVINRRISNIIVGRLNPDELNNYTNNNLIKYDGRTKADIKDSGKKQIESLQEKRFITLKGRAEGNYTASEALVGQAWGEVLGLDEIDIYDDFYTLGGDSILAIHIVNVLNKSITKKINISDLFENLTIFQLAEYLKHAVKTEMTIDKPTQMHGIIKHNLSNAQKRIWFLQKLNSDMVAYNLPSTQYMETRPDMDALNRALNELIERHWMLRTIFVEDNGIPKQIILDRHLMSFTVIDLSKDENEVKILHETLGNQNHTVFDMSKPLMRACIYLLSGSRCCLYFNFHHLIIDGWGIDIFFRELMDLYCHYTEGHSANLKPVKIQYVNWVEQREKWEKGNEFRKIEEYWLQEICNPIPQLNLPVDYQRPVIQTYNGSSLNFCIGKEQTDLLKKLSRKCNTTLHTVLLATYFLFLEKISGDEDIIIGVPGTMRDSEEAEAVLGIFVNMFCMRLKFNDIHNLNELIEEVKRKSLDAYKNSGYPFETLVSKVNPERDLSRNTVFNTVFQFYDNIPPEIEGVSQFELSLLSKESNGSLALRFEFNTDLFKPDTIKRFIRNFMNIVNHMVRDSCIDLANIEILDCNYKNDLLHKYTNHINYTFNKGLCELIEERMLLNPDNISVEYEGQYLTNIELNDRADTLGKVLKDNGAVTDVPIGIICGRNLNLISGLLGILKAGTCYVPLDPDYPSERISYIVKSSGAKIILAESSQRDKVTALLEDGCSLETVVYMSESGKTCIESIERNNDICINKKKDNYIDNLMYIIYTSGSTGLPKGVMVTQQNVLNYLKWSIDEFKLTQSDTMMLITSVCFDISVFEIFGALLSGAKLCIVPLNTLRDPHKLLDFINNKQVNIWHSVPTLMAQLLIALDSDTEQGRLSCFNSMRHIMIGGEAWGIQLAKEIRKFFRNADITNMYGPTEATIWITSYHIGDNLDNLQTLPIGKPVAGNTILILDGAKKLCDIGITGEIYVKGINVTRGYHNDTEKTASFFTTWDDGSVVYKTGDFGRYMEDGNIEFLGRKDGLVKVRGYRIELGEIENILLKKGEVDAVAVVSKKYGESNQLACYYTSTAKVNTDDLKDYLRKKLPVYMIPSIIMQLDEMPITPNGKIDKNALPDPKTAEIQTHLEPPASIVERKIAEIWFSILGTREISVNDSFFDVGGDSFLVVQIHSKISHEFEMDLTVTDLFKYHTIRELAAYIVSKEPKTEANDNRLLNEVKEDIIDVLDEMMDDKLDIEQAMKKLFEKNAGQSATKLPPRLDTDQ
ncbi:hypothetical protein acsn021_37370 [Anaerocolumna cellulosilytica]|uniref:Uncharacterized protein n=1 Tax=Anaerocolumna cellulosilytica TaxID=433286 RepID=A0A6S6RB92_9FIRM|nr:non-ribosomal peptide synthetase [Anaerocolumna cellulosilytica]MBB5194995.1 amino acid adenylation domain-containing protein [Anaerocolumna cellulosilytica]BCJ96168.1 hypothetical protein acsn021_37370 [Anaerocolumna cellulosilytica]